MDSSPLLLLLQQRRFFIRIRIFPINVEPPLQFFLHVLNTALHVSFVMIECISNLFEGPSRRLVERQHCQVFPLCYVFAGVVIVNPFPELIFSDPRQVHFLTPIIRHRHSVAPFTRPVQVAQCRVAGTLVPVAQRQEAPAHAWINKKLHKKTIAQNPPQLIPYSYPFTNRPKPAATNGSVYTPTGGSQNPGQGRSPCGVLVFAHNDSGNSLLKRPKSIFRILSALPQRQLDFPDDQ